MNQITLPKSVYKSLAIAAIFSLLASSLPLGVYTAWAEEAEALAETAPADEVVTEDPTSDPADEEEAHEEDEVVEDDEDTEEDASDDEDLEGEEPTDTEEGSEEPSEDDEDTNASSTEGAEEKGVISNTIEKVGEVVKKAVDALFGEDEVTLTMGADNIATIDVVEIGKTYVAPQDSQVKVTFTKLPETPGSLSIEQVILTDEQVAALGALSNVAYDITSNMENGTFAYDLELPKPEGASDESKVVYADSADALGAEVIGEVASEKVEVLSEVISVTELDHFTIFLVTLASVSLDPFPSTNAANKAANRPYVEFVSNTVGSVTVNLINPTNSTVWFEVKKDEQPASGTNKYGPCRIGVEPLNSSCNGKRYLAEDDYSYPSVSVIKKATTTHTITGLTEKASVRMTFGPERDWDFDWVSFEVLDPDPTNQHQLNLSGSVYRDHKLNDCTGMTSCYDQGENLGTGWTVNLYEDIAGTWQFISTAMTNASGTFGFPTLYEAGTYYACLEINDGWTQQPQNWSGTPYHLSGVNASGNADEGPHCRVISYDDTADRSNKFYFGVVDTKKPFTEVISPDSGNTYKTVSLPVVEATSNDGESGLVQVTMNLYGPLGLIKSCVNQPLTPAVATKDFSCDLSTLNSHLMNEGDYYLKINSKDAGGNVSNTVTWNFTIDNGSNPPTVTIESPTPAEGSVVKGVITGRAIGIDDEGMGSYYLRFWKDAFEIAGGGTLVGNCQQAPGADLLGVNVDASCDFDSTSHPDGVYVFSAQFQDSHIQWGQALRTFTVDNTAPTLTIKPESKGNGVDVFKVVSFKLYDKYKVDKVEINGVVKDLSNNQWSDVNGVKPGVFGAVEGENTIVLYDVAGNTTTLNFILDTVAPAAPTGLGWKDSNNNSVPDGGETELINGTAVWDANTETDLSHYIYRYWNDISTSAYNSEANAWVAPNIGSNSLAGTFNQGEGVHYFCVIAVDHAGNQSACSEEFTITYETNPVIPPTPTFTFGTTTVSSSTMNGWGFFTENAAGDQSGRLVSGPSGQPLGMGSAEFILTADNQGQALGTIGFIGTTLKDIVTLTYQTYRTASGDPSQAVALSFEFDNDVTDADSSWKGRMVYEPYHAHAVNTGVWQEWNTLDNAANGNWWGSGSPLSTHCPQSNPCTWDEILTLFPNAGIRDAGIGTGLLLFKAGSGWTNFNGNVDKLVIGVKNGSNTHTETFDFEPEAVVTPPTDDQINTVSSRSSSSGGRIGTFTTTGPVAQVLGASTDGDFCVDPYLTANLGLGLLNLAPEVVKLQNFLNTHMNASLPVTGVFGELTRQAVMSFQAKHAADILAPWGISTPTGMVYHTTKKKINEMACDFQREFPLTQEQLDEINNRQGQTSNTVGQTTPSAPKSIVAGASTTTVTPEPETVEDTPEENVDTTPPETPKPGFFKKIWNSIFGN